MNIESRLLSVTFIPIFCFALVGDENTTIMVQPKQVVDIMTFVDEWSRCISTINQMGVYYRQGSFDDCSKEWQDVKTAVHAKLQGDADIARKILTETSYSKRSTESPTVGIIWKLKEKPGWDIN